MKHLLLFGGLSVALLSHATRALGQAPAADTVTGQTKFTRRLAATLCTRIQESGSKQPFAQLSPKQADDLFMGLMMTSMGDQAAEFTGLLTEAKHHKISSNKLGHDIGVAAVKQLSADCPSSMALLMRTSSAQREMGAKNSKSASDISTAEKEVLQPLADTICVKLNAENARRPLNQRTATERSEVATTLIQTTVLKNMNGLLTVYSVEQIQNKDSMQAFGIKLATLMMTQCPAYIIMLGEDKVKSRH